MPGRNDPCPCGSGKKYKKCCGAKAASPAGANSGRAVDLPGAIACFENGNYAMAVSMAEAFLKQYPKEPAAWQVLGVSNYFLGDLPGAENAFRNLLKHDKRNPDALNNLGLVLLEQGQAEEAEKYCQQALKITPDMPGAYNNLGNIYRALGLQVKAENAYRKAIKLGMQNPEIYCNLGTVLQEQGHNEDARKAYEKALSIDDQFVAALSNLGGLLLTELKPDEAWQHLQRAEELAPDDVDVLNALGNYYHETGELEKAEASFLHAVEIEPENPEVNYRIGFYYQQMSALEDARRYLEKAVRLEPNHAKALVALGEIYNVWFMRQQADEYLNKAMAFGSRDPFIVRSYCKNLLQRQRYKEVLPIWEHLQQILPDNPSVHIGLAEYYAHVGDYEEADKYYKKLTEHYPEDANYYFRRADMNESRHQLDAAIKYAEKAIALAPEHVQAHVVLAKVYTRKKKYDKALLIYKKIDELHPDKEKHERPGALFERAKLLDKLRQYDAAYEQLIKANYIKSELIGKSYDHEIEIENIKILKDVYSKENSKQLPRFKVNSEENKLVPIFIVGFPRSGTTLLEQILTSHSKVSAGDELVFIQELKDRLPVEIGSQNPYPECLNDKDKPLTQAVLGKLRQHYFDRVKEQGFVAEDSIMFTDKMPHNLFNLGLISCVFPDAPIIHITRHPMDACLSAFMANFANGHRYTATIEETARHYARLMDLTEHYKSELDMKYLQIRYEDLVDNTEENAHKVIKFIGLPWEDACLKFYESKRISRTASYAQVTQKIYTSSRYRYKNYYKYFEPFEPILHESLQRFGYTFEP